MNPSEAQVQTMNAFLKENGEALKRRISAWRLWRKDRRGLAAIEFAMIFPVMIGMYMGAAETSQVLTLSRKITNITAATADLVGQEKTITDDMITEIFTASTSMIVPYDEAPISIIVSSIISDATTGATTVDWSDAHNGSARTPGAAITIPAGLIDKGETVIYTEVSYQYDSVIGHFVTDGFTLEDKFYNKPRRTLKIKRE
jgi:Flp pilus assembly protein TadG